jgi:DNA-binding CsgD family transcriptional regulator
MKPLQDGQAEAFVDEFDVLWIANGPKWTTFESSTLNDLEPFSEELYQDHKAQLGLNMMHVFNSINRLEKFIRCRYAGSDNKPDIDADGTRNPEYKYCSERSTCFGCGMVCKKPKVQNGHLTFHECEIIALMATDIPDKQVAFSEHLSIHTINNIRRKVQRKLGVYTKLGIGREASNLGIFKNLLL